MKKKYLIALFIGVSSFVANGNENKQVEPLEEGEGYIVLRVVVNGEKPRTKKLPTGMNGIIIEGSNTYTLKNLYQGQNIEVIKLPEGDYSWSTIKLSYGRYINLKDLDFHFSVVAGKINYGGDLLIDIMTNSSTKLDYVNRGSFARSTITASYPKLLKSHDMIYTGLSKDIYFDFINKLESGESK